MGMFRSYDGEQLTYHMLRSMLDDGPSVICTPWSIGFVAHQISMGAHCT